LIKVYNPKPISEIKEMKQKGIYHSPFSAFELINVDFESKIDEIEFTNAIQIAGIYEEMDAFKKQAEETHANDLVSIYETLGGM